MKRTYDVTVHELQWRNVVYRVEAENEEEARELVEEFESDVIEDDFDCVEQMDIENIKLCE